MFQIFDAGNTFIIQQVEEEPEDYDEPSEDDEQSESSNPRISVEPLVSWRVAVSRPEGIVTNDCTQ